MLQYLHRMPLKRLALAGGLLCLAGFAILYSYAGWYSVNVLLRRGGTTWGFVQNDSSSLSPSMRAALLNPPPVVQPGPFEWRMVAEGFEVAELPAVTGSAEVDRVLLARVDPALFRFIVRSAPAGDKGLDDWMAGLGAALVINGSYYGRTGAPDTPVVSGGVPLGPAEYDARHGAFIASTTGTAVRDLAGGRWQDVLAGAEDAMVSYPLLLAADGSSRVNANPRWLANRSFVGQDGEGRIVLGTTTDAFFSLDRFATFLRAAPLGLSTALNLDGGPVACQAVAVGGYRRRFCGRWETQTRGDDLKVLSWPYGTWALPIVLAVVRK